MGQFSVKIYALPVNLSATNTISNSRKNWASITSKDDPLGLHRHALMSMMAYAFLQSRRLAQAGRKKSPRRLPTHFASSAPGHP
jgi:hypothetical protein